MNKVRSQVRHYTDSRSGPRAVDRQPVQRGPGRTRAGPHMRAAQTCWGLGGPTPGPCEPLLRDPASAGDGRRVGPAARRSNTWSIDPGDAPIAVTLLGAPRHPSGALASDCQCHLLHWRQHVELQSFTSCLRGEDSIMPSRPSQTKLNSAVRKLKQTGRELERAGHRLEIVRRDAERQARRTRSQLRMQPNTSTHLSPSEWHLLEQGEAQSRFGWS